MNTRHTPTVGRKFDADGTVLRFRGNSIVSTVGPELRPYFLLEAVQERLRTSPIADRFALLPPSSFHMTVFDLVCELVREPQEWSLRVPLEAELEEADRVFADALRTVPTPGPLNMRLERVHPGTVTCHVRVGPADLPTARALRDYRDAVAEATGVRRIHHDRYGFHISLAYLLRVLDEEEHRTYQRLTEEVTTEIAGEFGTLRLPEPELVFFDDMCEFPLERSSTGKVQAR